eukprot:103341-Amphidinium_carterae.1
MNDIPLGLDASTRRWTTSQGLRDLADGLSEAMGGFGRIQSNDLVSIYEIWRARQTWATSGSAAGFSASMGQYEEFDEDGVATNYKLSDLLYESAAKWIELVEAGSEAAPGSEAAGSVKPYPREGGGAEKAIEAAILGTPALRAGAFWKEEDGKRRLLLAGELTHNVITELMLQSLEGALYMDARVDHPQNIVDQFKDLAQRVRAARIGQKERGRRRQRCWDYADFNAQHSLAAM